MSGPVANAPAAAKPNMHWSPTDAEYQVYQEWQNYTIGYLVSCRMGIQPGYIQSELKQQTGDMIPLDKMGLPVPNIKFFLYPMAMKWNQLMFRDVNGSLYVFINETAVPEEMANIRKLVLGQKLDRNDFPLRTEGVYVPPQKMLTFKDYRPIPKPPTLLESIMRDISLRPPLPSWDRRRKESKDKESSGTVRPSKPKTRTGSRSSKTVVIPQPKLEYSKYSLCPLDSEMETKLEDASNEEAPNETRPVVLATTKADEPTAGSGSDSWSSSSADDVKEVTIPAAPPGRPHKGKKVDVKQRNRRFAEYRQQIIQAAANPKPKVEVGIGKTPAPKGMENDHFGKLPRGLKRDKRAYLKNSSEASSTAKPNWQVRSMSRTEFWIKLDPEELKSILLRRAGFATPAESARWHKDRKLLISRKKWESRLTECRRLMQKESMPVASNDGQSVVGKSTISLVAPEESKILAPGTAPPPGSQATALKLDESQPLKEFRMKMEGIKSHLTNLDLDAQQERGDGKEVVQPEPVRDGGMLDDYIPHSGRRFPKIWERTRAQ